MPGLLNDLFDGMLPTNLGGGNNSNNNNNSQQQQQQQQVEEAPVGLDKYKNLTEPTDPKTLPEKFDPSKLFDTDPAKLHESVSKLDFTRGISQEDAQAIFAGGEGALVAFKNVLNTVSRDIFSNSLTASSQLVQAGVAKSLPAVNTQIQSHFRSEQVNAALRNADPIFESPVAKIMLDPVRDKLMEKHPTASAEEIARLAKEVLADFATTATAKDRQQQEAAKPKTTDWDSFLN